MQNSCFDLENRYASLSEAGDPLEGLNAVIDWEIFRPILPASTAPRAKARRVASLPLPRAHAQTPDSATPEQPVRRALVTPGQRPTLLYAYPVLRRLTWRMTKVRGGSMPLII